MSVSCTSTPTATTTIVETTDSLSTSFTTLTSTLPDSTSVSSTTECLTSVNSTCASSTVSSTTTTITGGITTSTSQVVITVPVTTTSISTLFGSSCTTSSTSSSSSPSSSGSSSSSSSLPPPSNQSTTTTITSQATSTNAQGQTTVYTTIVTSVFGANTTVAPPSVQSDNNGGSSSSSSSSGASAHLGAIIGGTVGGVFGLLALALIVWFIVKRKRRWDDIFEHDEAIGGMGASDRRFSLSADLDGEPKPYEYGLVGMPKSTPAPGSPPLRATDYGDERRPSLSPVNLPSGAVATGLQLRTPSSTSVSRPSTAGSTQPLTNNGRPLSQHGTSYPPGMQQYYQQQQQQQQQQHSRAQSTTTTSHSTSPSLSQPPMQPVTSWMMNTGSVPQPELSPRAGSPVSFQEPRRLHVANLRDSTSSPALDDFPGSPTAAVHRPSMSVSSVAKGPTGSFSGGNVFVHTDGGPVQ